VSRLRSLYVPFVQGADESVDPKVLPDGVFARLENARLTRAGDVRLRHGWRPIDVDSNTVSGATVGSGALEVVNLYSLDQTLVTMVHSLTGTGFGLQTLVDQNAARPWVLTTSADVTPVTGVRSVSTGSDVNGHVYRASAAVSPDGVWGAVLQQTSTQTVVRVFRYATDETLHYSVLATDSLVRKLVALGDGRFAVLRYSGTALQIQTLDPDVETPTWSTQTTLVTASITQFDAATALESVPTALHVVYVVGGAISYAQFDFSGAQVGSTKTVLASGGAVAYVASDDDFVHVAYQASGTNELSLLSFDSTSPYTTTAGPTALDAGQAYQVAQFAVACSAHGIIDGIFVVGFEGSRVCNVFSVSQAHAVSSAPFQGEELVGGLVAAEGSVAFSAARGQATGTPPHLVSSVLVSGRGPWFIADFGSARRPSNVFSYTVAHQPYVHGACAVKRHIVLFNRRSNSTATQSRGADEDDFIQVLAKACDLFDVTTSRPGAAFAGALYIAGGMLTQYIAGDATENGFLTPVINSVTDSNGAGALGPGTYAYRAAVVWTDDDRRVHRSPLSDPATVLVDGANDTVTAVVRVGKTGRRLVSATRPKVELYRTEAGPGELFYLVATGESPDPSSSDEATLVDVTADADILDNRRPYTEGEFGAVSGVLDVAPPIASRFVAATADRVVVASADGPRYHISQLALPEEPISFAQPGVSGPAALVYQREIEGGQITGLATMDDQVVLGTPTSVHVASAPGPAGPNLAGVGEFPPPVRLPGTLGVYNADSLVEDSAGLWFLSAQDRLMLVPRGQGVAVEAGKPGRELLAGGIVVGAGRQTADDLTAWALSTSHLLWRHETDNQWGHDVLPFIPKRLVSHLGELYAVQTPGLGTVWHQDNTLFGDGSAGGTAVVLTAETGDFQVFGLGGHGRLAVVEALGQFQAAAALELSISYDSGASYTSLGAHSISGLAVGEAFQRLWAPSRQRGGKFRLKLTMTPTSTTTEGCRLTGLTLYYSTATGPTRLDSAKRK
jgi:hypothetical protein